MCFYLKGAHTPFKIRQCQKAPELQHARPGLNIWPATQPHHKMAGQNLSEHKASPPHLSSCSIRVLTVKTIPPSPLQSKPTRANQRNQKRTPWAPWASTTFKRESTNAQQIPNSSFVVINPANVSKYRTDQTIFVEGKPPPKGNYSLETAKIGCQKPSIAINEHRWSPCHSPNNLPW